MANVIPGIENIGQIVALGNTEKSGMGFTSAIPLDSPSTTAVAQQPLYNEVDMGNIGLFPPSVPTIPTNGTSGHTPPKPPGTSNGR